MKRTVAITAAMLVGLGASAAVIVDFNREGVSANALARAADINTTLGDTWNFSDSTPLISSTDGTNSTVYGGMATTWSTSTDYNPNLRHLASEFQIQVQSGLGNTAAKGMLVWKKEDFLNGANAQTVGFSSGDSLSVNFTTIAVSSRSFRFVVNQGGSWYVSNIQKSDTTTGVWSIDPTSYSWRTITTDGNYTIAASGAMIALDDIRAVGLYMDVARTGNQTLIKFDGFQANVSAIPEPGTLGLVALASGGLVVLRRVFTV